MGERRRGEERRQIMASTILKVNAGVNQLLFLKTSLTSVWAIMACALAFQLKSTPALRRMTLTHSLAHSFIHSIGLTVSCSAAIASPRHCFKEGEWPTDWLNDWLIISEPYLTTMDQRKKTPFVKAIPTGHTTTSVLTVNGVFFIVSLNIIVLLPKASQPTNWMTLGGQDVAAHISQLQSSKTTTPYHC